MLNRLEIKLLARTGIFFLFLFLLMLTFGRLVYVKVLEAIYNNALAIPSENKVLIFGDSHAATCLNPEFMEDTISLAVLSEPIYYTEKRIKYWYKKKKIEEIILSLSYHNISAKKAVEIYGIPFLDRYYYFLQDTKLPVNTIKQFVKYILSELKFRYGIPLFGTNYFSNYIFDRDTRYVDMGYYLHKSTDISDERTEEILGLLYYSSAQVSDLYVDCVREIARFCYENDISLNVISTPLYSKYLNKIPETMKTAYNELIKELISEYKINFNDYTNFLPDAEDYVDADHLNFEGAKKLSLRVGETQIQSGGR